MKLKPEEQQELTKLLTRIYNDIAEIETQFDLRTGEGDMRVRIEYFHDAIRAFFAGGDSTRLTVELLAYDVKCLRYIQQNPFAPFMPQGGVKSASVDVTSHNDSVLPKTKRPGRAVRQQLTELYQHYAVLFAALLKQHADDDFEERTHHLNEDVKDIHRVMQQMENFKVSDLEALLNAVANVEDTQLRGELTAFINAGKVKSPAELKKLIGYLKTRKKQKDEKLANIDEAHMEYATGQLALYETSKNLLKSLAERGMNLVGKFVENSIAQTRQQMGR